MGGLSQPFGLTFPVIVGTGESTGTPAGDTVRAPNAAGTNIAGAALTIAGGQSTGTGAGGSIILQTSPAGGGGAGVNALVTRLTINSAGEVGVGIAPVAASRLSASGIIGMRSAGVFAVWDSGNTDYGYMWNNGTGARIDFTTGATMTMASDGSLTLPAALTIGGNLDHNGTGVGFFGIAPVTRASAYTQTYATADKTHAASTFAAVGETASTQTTPWGYSTQAQADAIPVELNDLADDVTDLKQLVNAIIDDLQAYGLFQ